MKPGRLMLFGGLLAALAACANPFRSEQGTITLPNGDEVSFPLDRGRGQVTLDAESFVAVVETRSREGDRPFCGGGVGGLPNYLGPDEYITGDDTPGLGQIWIGYFNNAAGAPDRPGIADRCEDRFGATYHAIVDFDSSLLERIVDEASSQRGERVYPRLVSATLRTERSADRILTSERCTIGQESPLRAMVYTRASTTITDPPPGVRGSDIIIEYAPPADRTDLEILKYPEGSYAGDGRNFTMSIAEFYLRPPLEVAGFAEDNTGGVTTVFIFGNDTALERMNMGLGRGFTDFSATLFSVANTQYGTRNSCLALYDNVRLNLEYELVPLS